MDDADADADDFALVGIRSPSPRQEGRQEGRRLTTPPFIVFVDDVVVVAEIIIIEEMRGKREQRVSEHDRYRSKIKRIRQESGERGRKNRMTRHNHHGGDSDFTPRGGARVPGPPPRRFAHPLRIPRLSQPSAFGGSVQRRLPLALGVKYPPRGKSRVLCPPATQMVFPSLGSEAPVPPGARRCDQA